MPSRTTFTTLVAACLVVVMVLVFASGPSTPVAPQKTPPKETDTQHSPVVANTAPTCPDPPAPRPCPSCPAIPTCPQCPSLPTTPTGQSQFPLDDELKASDLPWDEYARGFQHDRTLTYELATAYLGHIYPWVIREQTPPVPMRVTKRPVPLPDPSTINCGHPDFSGLLTGKKLTTPRKIYDTIPFGFDMDNLEVRFHELDEVVDRWFIVESTRTQSGLRKPLFFNGNSARYARFLPRIESIVLDDRVVAPLMRPTFGADDWKIEETTRYEGWKLVEKYANGDKEAVAISFDTDLFPSGYLMWHIKHCELRREHMPATIHPTSVRNNIAQCWTRGMPGRIRMAHDLYTSHRQEPAFKLEPFCHAIHLGNSGGAASTVLKLLAVLEGAKFPTRVVDDTPAMRLYVTQNPQREWAAQIAKGTILDQENGPRHMRCGDTQKSRDDCGGGQLFIPWVIASNPERYPNIVPAHLRNTLPKGNKTHTENWSIIGHIV